MRWNLFLNIKYAKIPIAAAAVRTILNLPGFVSFMGFLVYSKLEYWGEYCPQTIWWFSINQFPGGRAGGSEGGGGTGGTDGGGRAGGPGGGGRTEGEEGGGRVGGGGGGEVSPDNAMIPHQSTLRWINNPRVSAVETSIKYYRKKEEIKSGSRS